MCEIVYRSLFFDELRRQDEEGDYADVDAYMEKRLAEAEAGYTAEEQRLVDLADAESGSDDVGPDGMFEYRR